ncbi:MAG: FAD-dependent oxidoreductase [Ignavibacteriaceae bacterium]|nr:FAD-dependent oxidoreductase [Ignavibacteriaceae bacterium]
MTRCLIIGGGLAGLSAAVHLSQKNISIELLESSPKLGGRAYSFIDSRTGIELDNGQHLLMGCYSYTLEYLNIINSLHLLQFPESLSALFQDGQQKYHLKVPGKIPFPLNLILGLLGFNYFSLSEKISLMKFITGLRIFSDSPYALNAEEWLKSMGQDAPRLREFWRLMIVSALNCKPEEASASVLRLVITEMFMRGTRESSLLVPKTGLSRLLIVPAVELIKRSEGVITLSERVKKVITSDRKVLAVITEQREIRNFDFVIIAAPVHSDIVKNIISYPDLLDKYSHSLIVSVHVLRKTEYPPNSFTGFFNSVIHWIFFHENHFSLVISSAKELYEKGKDNFLNLIKTELSEKLGITDLPDEEIRILTEKRATFIPSVNLQKSRISAITNYSNLFLAGDYTDTGLPSTIEGAIKSGKKASELVIKSMS